jgi:predicted metal-dependent hydrolase
MLGSTATILVRAIAFARSFHYVRCMRGIPPRDRYGRLLPRGSRDELASDGEPEEVVGSAREACRRGIALFDEGRFFEAHEFFEYVWKADEVDDRDRIFWKGVTQVAVGCCHAQRGNSRGALALLERAAGHLRRFPSSHGGIDTTALASVARSIADQVRQRGASASLDFPKFPTVRG